MTAETTISKQTNKKPEGPAVPKHNSSEQANEKARDVQKWNKAHKPIRTSINQKGS